MVTFTLAPCGRKQLGYVAMSHDEHMKQAGTLTEFRAPLGVNVNSATYLQNGV